MRKFRFILKYIKPLIFLLVAILFLAIVFVIAQLVIPIISGNIIDYIEEMATSDSIDTILTTISQNILFIVLLIVFSIIMQYLFEFLSSYFVQSLVKKFRDDLYTKYNKLAIKDLDSRNKGDLLLREINDIENISNGLIGGFKQFYQGIISIIVIFVIMFYLNWLLAMVIVLITPLSIYISYFIAKKCSKYFKLQASSSGKLSSFSLESLNNLIINKTYNFEDNRNFNFQKLDKELYKCGQKAQFYSSWINPTTRFLNNITYCFVLLLGAFMIVYSDAFIGLGLTLSVGGLQALLVYANSYAKPFNDISATVTELQNAFASFNRVYEILTLDEEVNNGTELLNDDINELVLKNVDFSYGQNKKIIDSLSFNLNKGQRISIVGKTGCGKTTIINLIMGFYKIQNGEILINNKNLYSLNIDKFRENIAMVLQDTWIFNGTVKENIAFGSDISDENLIIEAAKKAQADNFIRNLKSGYDTLISDNSGLSIGEMQLICIARAILKNPNFVILDEATSNIDALTEDKVTKAFDKLLKHKTSIVIAHRLPTIKNSDLIIVLDSGKIIESGNHEQLIKNKGAKNKYG